MRPVGPEGPGGPGIQKAQWVLWVSWAAAVLRAECVQVTPSVQWVLLVLGVP